MKTAIGSKLINFKPMTRLEYSELRGWTVPADENPADEGYLVEYINGGKPNHPDFEGYISWSPKDVFENSYQAIDSGCMSFGHAIEMAKAGYRIARKGWNGKNMWVVFMSGMSLPPYSTQGTDRKVNDRTAKWIGEDTPFESLPYFAMWTADQKWLPGWLASQTDMIANDWTVIGEKA